MSGKLTKSQDTRFIRGKSAVNNLFLLTDLLVSRCELQIGNQTTSWTLISCPAFHLLNSSAGKTLQRIPVLKNHYRKIFEIMVVILRIQILIHKSCSQIISVFSCGKCKHFFVYISLVLQEIVASSRQPVLWPQPHRVRWAIYLQLLLITSRCQHILKIKNLHFQTLHLPWPISAVSQLFSYKFLFRKHFNKTILIDPRLLSNKTILVEPRLLSNKATIKRIKINYIYLDTVTFKARRLWGHVFQI